MMNWYGEILWYQTRGMRLVEGAGLFKTDKNVNGEVYLRQASNRILEASEALLH